MRIAVHLRRFFNGIRNRRNTGLVLVPSRFDGEGFEPLPPGLGATRVTVAGEPDPVSPSIARFFTRDDLNSYREDNWSPEFWRPLTRWGRFKAWVARKLRYIGVLPGYEEPNYTREEAERYTQEFVVRASPATPEAHHTVLQAMGAIFEQQAARAIRARVGRPLSDEERSRRVRSTAEGPIDTLLLDGEPILRAWTTRVVQDGAEAEKYTFFYL